MLKEKIKDSVESVIFEENSEKFKITISMGVSCNSKNISSADFIINTADKAVYKAKNSGKSTIVLYDD